MTKQLKSKIISVKRYGISVIIVGIIGTVGGVFIGTKMPNTISMPLFSTSQDMLRENNHSDTLSLTDVATLYHVLTTQYYKDIDTQLLIEGALEGMTNALDDPHSLFLNQVSTDELNGMLSGSFEGIGAQVMKDDNTIRIMSPIPDSPADKMGLLADDIIVEVDHSSVQDLNLNEVVQLIRGEKGTDVTLTIRRNDAEFQVTLKRDTIAVESIYSEVDREQPDIGYIQIKQFTATTYDELTDVIQEFEQKGVSKYIFDVRGNPGGLLDTALRVGNIFVPKGNPIMQIASSESADPHIFVASNEYGTFKFKSNIHQAILLIDEGSASASEILAGAMQSSGYPLIGTSTYGKGTVQTIHPLSGGTEVKYTHQIWRTASGEFIHGTGVTPDHVVEQQPIPDITMIDSQKSYQLGDVSDEVAVINNLLNMLGYDTADTDQFTEQTKQAIERIQSDHQLTKSGILEEATTIKLVQLIHEYVKQHDNQYDYALELFN